MTKQKEIYKCEICGNIVEVLHTGVGTLVCCGKPMILQKENSSGEYAEKHAPVIKEDSEGVEINVGKVNHPMTSEHYIEWIEISTDKGESKKFLDPKKDKIANAKFPVKNKKVKSRMYCNVHRLWKGK